MILSRFLFSWSSSPFISSDPLYGFFIEQYILKWYHTSEIVIPKAGSKLIFGVDDPTSMFFEGWKIL